MAAGAERGLLARYDAERLAVILIDTDLEAAIGQAESIARHLAGRRRGAIGTGPEASPAIGIAQFREDESLGHLIQRTAEALRRARIERGLAVAADRNVRERPAPCGGMPAGAACALKDDR
jgi:PleD family two-component response regulator